MYLHETEFIKSFMIKEKQSRYLEFVQSKKNRIKFLKILNHDIISQIQSKYIVGSETIDVKDLAESNCYIISDQKQFDMNEMTTRKALECLKSIFFGTIVSFKSGKLVCYKAESPSEIIWLKKE